MTKKRFYIFIVSVIVFCSISFAGLVSAQADDSTIRPAGAQGESSQTSASQSPSPGLVQCGRGGSAYEDATGCGFAQAVTLINKIINYLIIIATPLAATAFAYAGWLYLSAGDNPGQVSKAKEIFRDVGIGFIIILSGWLLFTLIAKTFLDPATHYGTYLTP